MTANGAMRCEAVRGAAPKMYTTAWPPVLGSDSPNACGPVASAPIVLNNKGGGGRYRQETRWYKTFSSFQKSPEIQFENT